MTRPAGAVHLHVDIASDDQDLDRLVGVARTLSDRGLPAKVTSVSRSLKGPHVHDAEFASDYALHTPELQRASLKFSAYLTAFISGESDSIQQQVSKIACARTVVGDVLKTHQIRRAVVEIERVCAAFADGKIVGLADKAPESGAMCPARFEAHHLVDADTDMSLSEWNDLLTGAGIVVGGWFEFEKAGYRAFRSVRFYDGLSVEAVAEQHARICSLLASLPRFRSLRIESIIEQILDLWRVEDL
jgi:hypothetical protein